MNELLVKLSQSSTRALPWFRVATTAFTFKTQKTLLTYPLVPYDLCVGKPFSCLLTIVVVAAFNQEKALVGAFYVITNLSMT